MLRARRNLEQICASGTGSFLLALGVMFCVGESIYGICTMTLQGWVRTEKKQKIQTCANGRFFKALPSVLGLGFYYFRLSSRTCRLLVICGPSPTCPHMLTSSAGLSYHIIWICSILYHIISYRIISYHISSCRIMLWRLILTCFQEHHMQKAACMVLFLVHSICLITKLKRKWLFFKGKTILFTSKSFFWITLIHTRIV